MKHKVFYGAVGLMLAMLSLIFMSRPASESAPDFHLKDSQGVEYSLSDYKGKPLIIHFWATWCPYCKKLQPGLAMLKQEFSDTDLEIIAISFNEDEGADPAGVLKERSIDFMTLVEGEAVAKNYKVPGTPTTVYINRRGERVWTTNISDPNHPNLKKAAEAILAP